MLCPLCHFDNPVQAQRCRACSAPLSAHSSQNGAVSSDALPDGTLLAGAYAVESVLGQGGFGITYRCHDRMLDRPVAVKEFFPSGCRRHNSEVQASRGLSDTDFREARAQFLAEARTLARCHHAGIVGVHAAFEANETAYMVMELLDGKSLAQLLSARGGRMNEAEAVGIIERVGEALQFVHEQNLLHRDIKPDNIIVCDDGRVMLIDFGTARETIQGQVQGQTVIVTPGYAPLEQYAKQARRGAFTDVYSLAATLYHLLTGQMPPAASDRAMGVMLREVREFNPNVSASVAHATQSALQMEIAKRPQSVREFLDLLHAPIEEAEVESFFHPQLMGLPFDEDEDEDLSETNGDIPAELTPNALRARQQLWQHVMPSANAQPVKLAPQRVFAPGALPTAIAPETPTHMSVAGGNVRIPNSVVGGGVRVQNVSDPDKLANGGWWVFAGIVGFVGFLALVNSGGQQKTATPPNYRGPGIPSSMRPPYSFGNNSYNSNMRPTYSFGNNSYNSNASQDAFNRNKALQEWDALPIMFPVSTEILPSSEKSAAQKNVLWSGGVEFSPDGKRLAYIDRQSKLRILSMTDRKIVRSLALDPKVASVDAMFSADNETVAVMQMVKPTNSSSNSTNPISVWSVRTGKKLGTFSPKAEEGLANPEAVFNNSDLMLRTLSAVSAKQKLFQWNPKTGKRSQPPIAAPDTANWGYGVISPNAREFVVGDTTGRLRWLDMGTGKVKHEQIMRLTQSGYRPSARGNYGGNTNSPLGVRGIDYSLDGRYLASRNDTEISVFDSKAQKVGSLPIDSRSMFFSISPDGEWVAAQGGVPYGPEGSLLWNVNTGKKIRLQSPFKDLRDYGFSQDGQQLYGIYATEDGQFQMVTWDVNGKTPAMFGKPRETDLQFSEVSASPHTPFAQSNDSFALASDSNVEIAPQNGGSRKNIAVERRDVAELGLSPDGGFLAVRNLDGAVRLWNMQVGEPVFRTQGKSSASQEEADSSVSSENLHNIAFSSDNRLWAYAKPNGASSIVELRTLEATPRLLASLPQKELVTTLKFSPDNKSLICGGDKGLLQWFDVATRKLRDSVATGETIFDVAFGARNLVVMGKDRTQLYNVPAKSKKPLQSATKFKLPADFDTSRDAYTVSAISPSGKYLALARDQGTVQIWDLALKMKLQDLSRDSGGATLIYGLKFSDDSNQITAIGQKLRERKIIVKTWTRSKSG